VRKDDEAVRKDDNTARKDNDTVREVFKEQTRSRQNSAADACLEYLVASAVDGMQKESSLTSPAVDQSQTTAPTVDQSQITASAVDQAQTTTSAVDQSQPTAPAVDQSQATSPKVSQSQLDNDINSSVLGRLSRDLCRRARSAITVPETHELVLSPSANCPRNSVHSYPALPEEHACAHTPPHYKRRLLDASAKMDNIQQHSDPSSLRNRLHNSEIGDFRSPEKSRLGGLETSVRSPGNLRNVQSTSGNVQSTLGNVQSTLGNVQSTLGSSGQHRHVSDPSAWSPGKGRNVSETSFRSPGKVSRHSSEIFGNFSPGTAIGPTFADLQSMSKRELQIARTGGSGWHQCVIDFEAAAGDQEPASLNEGSNRGVRDTKHHTNQNAYAVPNMQL
jgi:hypothetical protein